MRRELMAAVSQLSAERNLSREVVLSIVEAALAAAYKKYAFSEKQEVSVKLDPDTGDVKVYVRKTVVAKVADPQVEISLNEARKLRSGVQVGETVEIKTAPSYTGRIAVQAVKQNIMQRLREAEHQKTYEEFSSREGEIATGIVQFITATQVYVNLGRVEAVLPQNEQLHNEHYRVGQRLKLYLLEIVQEAKGTQIVVSRSHPNLLRRLFELEIPEVHNGVVGVEAVAREAGQRSKVAVSTPQEGVEPIGCCLGPRGIRLQNIVNELNGEKIDLIQWHSDPRVFIANALSPAQVASIDLDGIEKVATVTVPDRQLSLAIGKEGQNARLAAKLTGWRIDIRSVSAAEAEKAAVAEAIPQEVTEEAKEEELALAGEEEPVLVPSVAAEAPPGAAKKELVIRFAEDILPHLQEAETPQKQRGKAKAAKAKAKPVKAKAKPVKAKAKSIRRRPHFEEDEGEE